jgi:hypothetical protein
MFFPMTMIRLRELPRRKRMEHYPCSGGALRDVWLVYGNPADIHSSDRVGVAGVPARSTEEQTLRLSIGSIHIPTLRTGPGSVARVHQDQRNPCPLRLVGNLLSQIEETPGMLLPPLAFSNRYPVPDALQILRGNPAAGVFRPLHQFLRNPMIFLPGKPPFLLAALLQQTFGRLPTLALQAAAQLEMALSQPVDLPARVLVRIAVDSDVLHAQVHLRRCRSFHITGSQQAKVTLPALPRQQFQLPLAGGQGDPLPSPDRPNRDASSFQIISQDPAVEGNRPGGSEHARRLMIELVGVRHPGNTSHHHLGGQRVSLPHRLGSQFVQGELTKGLVLPRLLADGIAGSIGRHQRLAERVRLLGGRQEFYLRDQPHTRIVPKFQRKGGSVSSLAASGGVSALFFR